MKDFVLRGRIGETRKAIEIVHDIRHATPVGLKGEHHPLAKLHQ